MNSSSQSSEPTTQIAIREIRGHVDPAIASIPALALTAYGGLEERRVLLTGFNAYLPKPVDADHLVRAVAYVVASRAS